MADGTDAKADSKKKKKKKAKKDDEPAPAPAAAAAGKKKGAAGISALKALMEERKRLEEEARLKEEEERKRIEEEDLRAEEEARRKEEEKQRKKEKEKVSHSHLRHPNWQISEYDPQAKRELAKKEGRLLTKKQKEEMRAAELRKQALLASGVQIEGLQQGARAPVSQKKVVYENRKKKKGTTGQTDSGHATREPSPERTEELAAPESEPASPSVAESTEIAPAPAESTKDDWDASSEEEGQKPAAGVKDSWDDESDEEHPKEAPAKATSSGLSILSRAILSRLSRILNRSSFESSSCKGVNPCSDQDTSACAFQDERLSKSRSPRCSSRQERAVGRRVRGGGVR